MVFTKRLIDSGVFEAASVCDVDGDGIMDIVCGAYWYKGPRFTERIHMCDVLPDGEYFDDFCDYPLDVTGNGLPDIITGSWFNNMLRWRENPGRRGGAWRVHDIAQCGNIETIRFFDIDGCGAVEIFPNCPGAPAEFFKLEGKGRFSRHRIGEANAGHGLGFADVNGDGRTDVLLARGWLEQPEGGPYAGVWVYHEEFPTPFEGAASVPMLGADVAGNGLCDLIVGNGHGYGLYWYEQGRDATGARTWTPHLIDDTVAQYHDMQLLDIDGDGRPELVTGKRFRAHCGRDPGDNDAPGVYYFTFDKGRFVKHVIDEGEAGVGIYFWTHDLTGNGLPDIIAPGKTGLYLFTNEGDGKPAAEEPSPLAPAAHAKQDAPAAQKTETSGSDNHRPSMLRARRS